MTDIKYTTEIKTDDGLVKRTFDGILDSGKMVIVDDLPCGEIVSVKCEIPFHIEKDEKIFMNGYQTWTHCPEYTKNDRIRGMHRIPKSLIEKYHFDRYGDYHFVNYPYKKGITHGFSYCYFRNGDYYRFFGTLDEKPGYTMFCYDANREILTVERDCNGIKCDGEYHLFDLLYTEGSETQVFDEWFDALGIKPLTDKQIKGYSSWYNHYENINEDIIKNDLTGCANVMQTGDLFQIDDGWETTVGDWLNADETKFPDGMKKACDEIHEKGFKAGLWLAPFVCTTKSEVYRNHPDWLLRHDGKEWYDGSNWGGFVSLDIDNPEVIAYIRETFRKVFDEWGFDLVKLDFLYGVAPFGTENETRAARMIRAVDILREVCGNHEILGCGVPVFPAFGKFEYCRVSCDVSLDWNDKWYMRAFHRERVSTKQAIENSVFRRQLNGRAYLSDPDIFFLRENNISLSDEQKRTLAEINALIGGVYLTSDNMGDYSDEKIAEYKRLLQLREASDIKINADNGMSIEYTDNQNSRQKIVIE